MHDIEPHYHWRSHYIASEDEQSPLYGRVYNEFQYTQKIYNYFIHPQWDNFGSSTLYLKILFADYDEGFAIIELIGEWNDCINNDIMFLKRNIIDNLSAKGIYKHILICENVLNFHASDDAYYEEWFEDVKEEGGWLCFINILGHVQEEMQSVQLQHYANFGDNFNEVNWRPHRPKLFFQALEALIEGSRKEIYF